MATKPPALIEAVIVQEIGGSCCHAVRVMITAKSWRRYLREPAEYETLEVREVIRSCGHRHNIYSNRVERCMRKV